MITTAPTPADAGTPATSPLAGAPGLVAWYAEGFSDVLGDRLRLFDNAGPALELLRFCEPVATVPGFETAVGARIDALGTFSHPAFAKVRALTMLDDPRPQLALVSELVTGERLSTVLRAAQALGAAPDAGSAVWMLRQLLPALSALHEAAAGVSHGLIGPDRVIVTPAGSLVLTEYVLGDALSGLGLAPNGSDIAQTALLALAVLLGRPLRIDEYTTQLPDALDQACSRGGAAVRLRPWLDRALTQGAGGFQSARDALEALDRLAIGLPAAWSPALLPAGPESSEGRAVPTTAMAAPAVTTTAIRRLLAARAPVEGGWRANRLLLAVATIEAICIAILIARGAMTGAPSPTPAVAPPPAQVAGLVPPSVVAPTPDQPPPATPDPAAVLANAALTSPPAAAVAPSSVIGWLVIESEAEVKVYVNGRLLGLATRRRFGVPAGEHLVTLASDTSGFRSSQTVRIAVGRSVLIAARPSEPQ